MPEDESGTHGPEAVEDQIRQARQAVSDADGATDAGLSDAVVINRCYYACFHAAQAVLYDRGVDPGSHGGVLSLYGSEVVQRGDAPRDQGRLLNRLAELRRQADYGYGTIDEDVEGLLSFVHLVVDHSISLCGDR